MQEQYAASVVGVVTMPAEEKTIEERLEEWAHWARGPAAGGLVSAEGYFRERIDRAHDSAELTDAVENVERAVARAKMQDAAYWRVIARYYLGRMSEIEIAGFFGASEGGIKRLLDEAKAVIAAHLRGIERA